MIGTLNRVILFVHDMQRAAAFYRDVLGLQQTGHADAGWMSFDGGGCFVSLHAAGNASPHNGATQAMKMVFKVADVDVARAALISRGAAMGEIIRPDEHFAFCDGADPEGNPFQISSR